MRYPSLRTLQLDVVSFRIIKVKASSRRTDYRLVDKDPYAGFFGSPAALSKSSLLVCKAM